jgi:hypothetical protein
MGFVDIFRKLWGWLSNPPEEVVETPDPAFFPECIGTDTAYSRIQGTDTTYHRLDSN